MNKFTMNMPVYAQRAERKAARIELNMCKFLCTFCRVTGMKILKENIAEKIEIV